MSFSEKILGEKGVLLRLDTWNAEFMDHEDILQKPEDKEEIKDDSVYALESLKNIKLWTN